MRFLVLLIVLVVAIYLLVRVIDRRGVAGRGSAHGDHPAGGRSAARRPSAPDDDADFLRSLDRKRRHKRPDAD